MIVKKRFWNLDVTVWHGSEDIYPPLKLKDMKILINGGIVMLSLPKDYPQLKRTSILPYIIEIPKVLIIECYQPRDYYGMYVLEGGYSMKYMDGVSTKIMTLLTKIWEK